MPAPVRLLREKHGLDQKSLAAAFDASSIDKRPKVKQLVEEMRDRVKNGIERNRRDYRLYKAMDWAYDAPFYQISLTQLRGLMEPGKSEAKVMEAVNQWGLTHLLADVYDTNGKACCNSDGSPKKSLNLPVFFNVFVPICMAYITIRWAKLFNDRNLYPHFKYDPAQMSVEDRLRCELLTQIVQKMSNWYGYPDDTKQSLLQMLIYGLCINFPRESWHCEKQMDESGNERVVREGLRFDMPHPSRTYYDTYSRLSTLNNNSGCEFAGYWELQRFRDIDGNSLYWNKDKITKGATSWFDIGKSDFLSLVYPCSMEFPISGQSGIGGVGQLDRESDVGMYYGRGDADRATLVSRHFQRIIPAERGLGKYEHPIWMRFVLASDSPVLFAEPLAYDVLPTYAYDADFNRSRFKSLALELVPFQDHISNLMTHWILAVKQNLNNPIFVDTEKVPPEYLSQLKNLGEKQYSGNIYIPYKGSDNLRYKDDNRGAFHQPTISRHNIAEIANTVSSILGMLDRVMQVSPQEIGQAASHEQSAAESRIVAANTSNRVNFTGSFFDAGQHAKKRMIYDGVMAYADDTITVGISSSFVDDPRYKVAAKDIGLQLLSRQPGELGSETVKVLVQKSALQIDEFAATREAPERADNPAVAEAMAKLFIAVSGNEMIIQKIGVAQTIDLLNQIIVTAGLPQDFRLKPGDGQNNQNGGVTVEDVQQALAGFAEQVKKLIESKSQETAKAAVDASGQMMAQAIQGLQQQLMQVAQAVKQGEGVDAQQQQQIDEIGKGIEQLAQATQSAIQAQPKTLMAPEMAAPTV